MIKAVLTITLCLLPNGCQSNMETFVVEGTFSKITDFPHSAYLETYCARSKLVCGGSLLNQRIVLTAAHCMPDAQCSGKSRFIARFGHENKTSGIKIEVLRYMIHENYDDNNYAWDIALALLEQPVKFSRKISRVAIKKEPIRSDLIGTIAGWGYVNEKPKTKTDLLKHVFQKTMTRAQCENILGHLPEGVFCGRDIKGISYPSLGDSGCALIVNGFVQVGLVSYKLVTHNSIVIYTDIAYFYNWIRENALKLFCAASINKKQLRQLQLRNKANESYDNINDTK